jgi:hypothetical protein
MLPDRGEMNSWWAVGVPPRSVVIADGLDQSGKTVGDQAKPARDDRVKTGHLR